MELLAMFMSGFFIGAICDAFLNHRVYVRARLDAERFVQEQLIKMHEQNIPQSREASHE